MFPTLRVTFNVNLKHQLIAFGLLHIGAEGLQHAIPESGVHDLRQQVCFSQDELDSFWHSLSTSEDESDTPYSTFTQVSFPSFVAYQYECITTPWGGAWSRIWWGCAA